MDVPSLAKDESYGHWTGLGESPISAEDQHFFDVAGYIAVDGVLSAEQTLTAHQAVQKIAKAPGRGISAQRDSTFGPHLLNVIEHGGVCEDAMALPKVLAYVENLIWGTQYRLVGSRALLRAVGASTMLSQGGAADPRRYARYRCFGDGQFRCLMITCLIALCDTESSDGALCVIPSSHKSNMPHPYEGRDLADVPPLEPIKVPAGSAVLLTESLSYALEAPTRDPQAWLVYHYGPSFMRNLPGCDPSQELTARTKHDPLKAHMLQAPYYHPPNSGEPK
jgi:hypothetical protein